MHVSDRKICRICSVVKIFFHKRNRFFLWYPQLFEMIGCKDFTILVITQKPSGYITLVNETWSSTKIASSFCHTEQRLKVEWIRLKVGMRVN
ncbi:hypothetical protein VIGAN_08223000, partial [Vigna angularis var. angularis]